MSIRGQGRLLDLFQEICDHAPDEQEQRLVALTHVEPDIAIELRRLLAIDAICDEGTGGDHPPLDLQVGSRIDRFLLLEVLGQGGMGVVFRARDEDSGREYAVKVLRTDLPRDEDRARLEREAALLRRIDHPGICRIHDTGHVAGRFTFSPYLVMDLIDGLDLISHADEKGLDRDARLSLFERVCDAIQVAHRSGVLHRDLTPKNVLVRNDGTPVVIDFGLAYSIDSQDLYRLTRTGRGVGTHGYMSPEQEAGQPFDVRADVYALGVLLHELLTGRRPTRRKSGRPLKLDPTLSRTLRLIIETATAWRPRRRYAGVDDLVNDLRALRLGGRIEAVRTRSLRHGFLAVGVLSLCALQCGRWSRAAAQLDDAWKGGDLVLLQAGLRSLPAMLDPLLLPGGVQSSTRALRAWDDTAPIIRVLEAGRTRGRGAEVSLACRYVDRDGYEAHPLLLSSVERTLRYAAPSEREWMMIAASCLFDCREADTPGESAAVAGLRALFERWSIEDPNRSLGALSSLGGCGDSETLTALNTILAREDLDPETVRLCGRAVQRIVARAVRCGYAETVREQQLTDVRAGYQRQNGRHVGGPHAGVLSSTLIALGQAADLFRLENGIPIPGDRLYTAVRAQHEPEYGRRMMESIIGQLRTADGGFSQQAYLLEYFGQIVEFNRASMDDPLALSAVAVAQDVGLDADVARFHIDTGRQRASNHRDGRYPELRPSDEERLAHGLRPLAPLVRLTSHRAPPGENDVMAGWDFRRPDVTVTATATQAVARDAPLRSSDMDPDQSYLDLASAGRSQVRCTFRIADEVQVRANLRLEVVRARRVLVPHEGRAQVDVALDGVYLGTTAVDLAETHWIDYQLQAERLTLGEHELVITLPESATTAVRLHRVVVLH